MDMLMYVIIVLSSVSNMYADLLLTLEGEKKIIGKKTFELFTQASEKNLLISAVLGVVAIGFWQTPLYFMQHLTGVIGGVAIVSFAILIGVIMAFHPICCLCIHLVKVDATKEKTAMQYITYVGMLCFVVTIVFTLAMITLGVNGDLVMQWYHYAGLPLFTMVVIQFGLGKMFGRIRYFSSISGTLGMMISLLLLVHLLRSNFPQL